MITKPITRPLTSAITRAITDPAVGGGGVEPFDPATLFSGSDKGIIHDYATSSLVFQSSAGSGSVAAANDPIGYVTDLGPTARPGLQATSADRPLWAGVPRTLGSELVTNGRFATDSDWTKGDGFSIASNKATKTAGTASVLSQPITVTAGKSYFLTYVITRTAGTITPRFTGGTTVSGVARNIAGSFVDVFVAKAGNTTLEFSADASYAGAISNVTVKEVTSFTNMGAMFDGTSVFLATASVDMSGGDKMTIVSSYTMDQTSATRALLSFGSFAGSAAGSLDLKAGPVPSANLRGDTASATVSAAVTEGQTANNYCGLVTAATYDLSGASIATELYLYNRGVLIASTPSGSTAGGGNLANSTFTTGKAFTSTWRYKGLIHRQIAINRILDSTELANATAWAADGMVIAAVLGDSTVGPISSSVLLPNAMRVSALVGGMVCGAADVAKSGDRIADQKTLWTAISDKSALQAVFLQIGLNDVKGRVGANLATTAQVIADLQDLVDTVRADTSAGCKIYVCGLIPCKGWLDAATNPSAAYQAWLDVNAAIAGTHSTNITGVDGRITSHVAALNDGSGNLLTIYDYNADMVHESNEARFIIAQAWRTKLEADGLV